MALSSQPIDIQAVALGAASGTPANDWVAIRARIKCNGFILRAPIEIHVSTDPTDAAAEDDLPAGAQETWLLGPDSHRGYRFSPGDVVIYARSLAGATTVIAKFMR